MIPGVVINLIIALSQSNVKKKCCLTDFIMNSIKPKCCHLFAHVRDLLKDP